MSRLGMSGPRAALVVPVYGQADLLAESVGSLLNQTEQAAILLVDVACPDPRTAVKSAALAAARPGAVFYWRAPVNRGLSAMRNAGVRLALDRWPELSALAFVDGDDKTHPEFVARGLAALDAHAGSVTEDGGRVGWIYEDWDQFGTPEPLAAPAPFHPLFALAGCQHTPGAFISAEIFRDGIWFDETRRGGDAEDWQFWVQAFTRGWRGRFEPHLGFRYRRRVGGLAFAGRQQAARNRVLLQREFPALYHPDRYLSFETGRAARHLLLEGGGARIGPLHGGGLTLDAAGFGDLAVRLIQLPSTPGPAQALIFLGQGRTVLAEAGLLDWAAWYAEADSAVQGAPLLLTLARGKARLHHPPADPGTGRTGLEEAEAAGLLSVPMPVLLQALQGKAPLASLLAGARTVRLELPQAPLAGAGPPNAPRTGPSLADHAAWLDAALASYDQPLHPWRQGAVWRAEGAERPDLDRLHLTYNAPLSDPGARRASLLAITAADLGWPPPGIDLPRLARHLADEDGTRPGLVVLGQSLPPDRIDPGLFRALYLLPPGVPPEGLLAAFGRVVSVDCTQILPALNAVRRFGVTAAAVLPATLDGALAADMTTAFKLFHRLYLAHEDQAPALAALGVSPERMAMDLLAPDPPGPDETPCPAA